MTEEGIQFGAPATLMKYPSLRGERNLQALYPTPYTVREGTLGDMIRELMSKPDAQRRLYEIHTAPQPPLITDVLSVDEVVELSRLQEFL